MADVRVITNRDDWLDAAGGYDASHLEMRARQRLGPLYYQAAQIAHNRESLDRAITSLSGPEYDRWMDAARDRVRRDWDIVNARRVFHPLGAEFGAVRVESTAPEPDPEYVEASARFITEKYTRLAQQLLSEGPPEERTFRHAMAEFNLTRKLPFAGGVVSFLEMSELWKSARRVADGQGDAMDNYMLLKHLYEQQGDPTWSYVAGSILFELPGFMTEFFLTGGAAAAGRQAAQRSTIEMLKRRVGKDIAEWAERAVVRRYGLRGLAAASGELTRLPAFSARAFESAVRQAMPELSADEAGHITATFESDDDFVEAVAKNLPLGYLDWYIELLSEASGGAITGAITGAVRRVIPERMAHVAAKWAFMKRWLDGDPSRTAAQFMDALKRAGWHGVFGEMAEEFAGAVARAPTPLGTLQDVRSLASPENLAGMALAFAVPGATFSSARAFHNAATNRVRVDPSLSPESFGVSEREARRRLEEHRPVGQAILNTIDAYADDMAAELGLDEPPLLRPAQPATVTQAAMMFHVEQRGLDAVFVESEDGQPLPLPAYYAENGIILIDRNAGDAAIHGALLTHESLHALRHENRDVWEALRDFVNTVDPTALEVAAEEYRLLRTLQGQEFEFADKEEQDDEAMASLGERLFGLIAANPEQVERMATAKPSVYDKLVSGLQRLAGRIAGVNAATQAEIIGTQATAAKLARAISLALDTLNARPTTTSTSATPRFASGEPPINRQPLSVARHEAIARQLGRAMAMGEVRGSKGVSQFLSSRKLGHLNRPKNKEAKQAIWGRAKAYRSEIIREGKKKKPKKWEHAPLFVNGPKAKQELKDRIYGLIEVGRFGRFWYEISGDRILAAMNGNVDDAVLLVRLLALYSANTAVHSNWLFALAAYHRAKANLPLWSKVGPGEEASDYFYVGRDLEQAQKAQAIVDTGKSWKGEKTNNFYINLLRLIDPEGLGSPENMGVTVDRHMMGALGYYTGKPTTKQYAWAEGFINEIVDELNETVEGDAPPYEPQQVQAMVWVGYLNEDVPPEKREAHTFADEADANIGFLTMEMTPHETTGRIPFIHEQTLAARQAYANEQYAILFNEKGENIIAKMLGLIDERVFDGLGMYKGVFNPGIQFGYAVAPKPGRTREGAEPGEEFDIEESIFGTSEKPGAFELLAAAMGYIFGQQMVAYHRPFHTGKPTLNECNGCELRWGEYATDAQVTTMRTAIINYVGEAIADDIMILPTPDGFRFGNFTFGGIDNKDFIELIERAYNTAGLMGGTVLPDAKFVRFAMATGAVFNDWEASPNGQDYLEIFRRAGRSDLLGVVQTLHGTSLSIDEQWTKLHAQGLDLPQADVAHAARFAAGESTPEEDDERLLNEIWREFGRAKGHGSAAFFGADPDELGNEFWHLSKKDLSTEGILRKFGAEKLENLVPKTESGEPDLFVAPIYLYMPGASPNYKLISRVSHAHKIIANLTLLDLHSPEYDAIMKAVRSTIEEGTGSRWITDAFIRFIKRLGFDGIVDTEKRSIVLYRDITPEEIAYAKALTPAERKNLRRKHFAARRSRRDVQGQMTFESLREQEKRRDPLYDPVIDDSLSPKRLKPQKFVSIKTTERSALRKKLRIEAAAARRAASAERKAARIREREQARRAREGARERVEAERKRSREAMNELRGRLRARGRAEREAALARHREAVALVRLRAAERERSLDWMRRAIFNIVKSLPGDARKHLPARVHKPIKTQKQFDSVLADIGSAVMKAAYVRAKTLAQRRLKKLRINRLLPQYKEKMEAFLDGRSVSKFLKSADTGELLIAAELAKNLRIENRQTRLGQKADEEKLVIENAAKAAREYDSRVKRVRRDTRTDEPLGENRIKGGFWWWLELQMTPETLAEHIGGRNSTTHEVFYGALASAQRDHIRSYRAFMDDFVARLADAGMKPGDIVRWSSALSGTYSGWWSIIPGGPRARTTKAEIEDPITLESGEQLRLTKMERVYLLASFMDPNTLELIESHNVPIRLKRTKRDIAITPRDISAIMFSATAEEHAVANIMVEMLNTNVRQMYSDWSVWHLGYDASRDGLYFPRHRKYVQKFDSLTIADYAKAAMTSTGIAKERQHDLVSPILIGDALNEFNNHTWQVAGLYHMHPVIKHAKRVLDAPEFSRALDDHARGSAHRGYLNNTLNELIRDTLGSPYLEQFLQGLVAKGVRNVTKGALAANPFVMMYQTCSVAVAGTEMPLHYAVGGLHDAMLNGGEIDALIQRWSPYIAHRIEGSTFGIVNEGAISATPFHGFADEVRSDRLMQGIRIFDRLAVRAIFRGCENWVRNELRQSGTELGEEAFWEEVARRAEMVVKRTQPTFDSLHISGLSREARRHPTVKMLTMFMSQRLKNVNMMIRAIEGRRDTGVRRAVANLSLVALVQPLLLASIKLLRRLMLEAAPAAAGGHGDDDEWERQIGPTVAEFLDSIGSNFIGGQFVGGLIRRRLMGFHTDSLDLSPLIGVSEDLAVGLWDIADGVFDGDPAKIGSGFEDLAVASAILGGQGWIQFYRLPIRAIRSYFGDRPGEQSRGRGKKKKLTFARRQP